MRVARLALVAVLTLAALAACGDDGGSGADDGETPESFCEVADDTYSGSLPQPEGGSDAEDVVEVFRRLEDAAPPDIAGDIAILREYVAVLFGVEEASDDTPSQAELVAANENVTNYLADECGIVPPTTSAPAGTTVPTASSSPAA